jgi:DNA ligase-1
VNARTCKHLKGLLGEEYENARLFLKNPDGPQPRAKTSAKSRGKGKTKSTGDEGGKSVPQLLLANKWDLDSGPDPTGWWISEKLDGVRFVLFFLSVYPINDGISYRTYFDGKQMISRLGNPFTPPQWFLDSTLITS